jgi:GAF domain-containing protein/HAMP domain-containing protein
LLFERAQSSLAAFVQVDSNRQRLLALLSDASAGEAARMTATRVLALGLLDPASTVFESVRVLNAQGVVVASTTGVGDTTNFAPNVSQSSSAAYQEGRAAFRNGDVQTVVLSNIAPQPAFDFVHAIALEARGEAGYVIARISARQIAAALEAVEREVPGETYLISADGVLFAGDSMSRDMDERRSAPSVTRALAGESGTVRYVQNSIPVISFYAPVPALRMALVNEIAVADAEASALSYFSTRAFALTVAFAALAAVMVAALVYLNHLITPPLVRLRGAAQAMALGNYTHPVPDSSRDDEIGALASSFVAMREQVQMLVAELEARLAARARDIATTQQISQFAATQRDLQPLLDSVVALMIERFPNIYHAQIFLIDAQGQYAMLRASTGTIGQALLARGHRLAVGSISLVGQAAVQKRAIVAHDTAHSAIYKQQELLSETRAEMALPLMFGSDVIGVLDLQSKQRDAFSEPEIEILQAAANQIAVAIQTSRLYEESIQRLARIEAANQQATLRVWQDYMREQRLGELKSSAGVETGSDLSVLRRAAYTSRQIVVGARTERQTIPVAVPIQLGDQVLGAVEWEVPAADLNEDRLELAKQLANRLAIGLENARLFQESRRATERERLVNSIAARLTAQTNIHEILQTAVREVGQALHTPQVSIRLLEPENNGRHPKNGSHDPDDKSRQVEIDEQR